MFGAVFFCRQRAKVISYMLAGEEITLATAISETPEGRELLFLEFI